ncbi:transketolase [Arthrobacter sp. AFG20]|uniref:transketolase n=1 Tax=Arthrobacter sp. AFG20 TaxID=1688671 RepID=UPI000C9EB412|nr:transketolase [Arthrobacter sp. AFG20]PNH78943.1 transketolase [Arthrobacter sp. AFG20]
MSADVLALEIEAARARLLVLRMLQAGRSGHVGGALSCIDIVTALYFDILRIDPRSPNDGTRDRFLLSAGHKAMAQYAVLARRGYFPEDLLDTYGGLDSKFAGHPDMHKVSGIEANTGALGHGLAIAAGMALGLRMDGTASRVFTILGDGELPEGSNWEGASIAAHHGLDNLIAVIDVNDLQISGRTTNVMNMEPIADKFEAFGWAVTTIDGNNMSEVTDTLRSAPLIQGRPTAIVARTIKAKGISALEDTAQSHYWKPDAEALLEAHVELTNTLVQKIKARSDELMFTSRGTK